MPQSFLSPSFTFILLLFLSGCSTTWSESDKAKLSSVAIRRVTAAKDAYKKPDAKDSPGMANSLPTVTGGGLIPSLIGSAIDASVTAKQQRKFEATDAKYFEGLAMQLATPPVALIESTLKQMLNKHDFFGSRMAESASTAFTVEIQNYGLQKSPSSPDDGIRLRMRIIAQVSIKLPDGQVFWTALITGRASTSAFAKDILSDPGFMRANVQEATDDFCHEVIAQLNQKLTPRK